MVTGMYDYDLDLEVQREEAREEGIAQGAHEKAVETARGMLSYGMPADKVAEISGLSLAEVQQLDN